MIDAVLSLPTFLSAPIVTLFISCVGMGTYCLAYRYSVRHHSDQIREATLTMFSSVGILLSLFLSLTFADVMIELNTIENAVEKEAAALSDIHSDLLRFKSEEAREMQQQILDYTAAIIENDWPALANDELGEQAGILLKRLEDSALSLKPANAIQETLRGRILVDVDVLPDYRLSRLGSALAKPPFYLIVVLFAFLVTMLRIALYPPDPMTVLFTILYTLLIGMIVFLILAFSDPFQGATGVDPAPLEYLLEHLPARSY